MEAVIIGIIVLGILVIPHEIGHLLAGLRLGVRVLKFSIGFGPKVLGFRWRDIDWVVGPIPLGGYVKFAGEDPGETNEEPAPGDFGAQPWWVKLIVAISGPIMNVALAFVLLYLVAVAGFKVPDPLMIIGSVQAGSAAASMGMLAGDRITEFDGRPVTSSQDFLQAWEGAREASSRDSVTMVVARKGWADTLRASPHDSLLSGVAFAFPPIVGDVTMGYPAFEAGLQEGDSIASVAGSPVATFEDLRRIILASPDRDVTVEFIREGRVLATTVRPINGTTLGQGEGGYIGIAAPEGTTRLVRFGPLEAVLQAGRMTGGMVATVYSGFYTMVKNPKGIRRQLGGPIAIAQFSARHARKGFDSLVSFVAMFSVMLAVLNLLPIPILDGATVVFSVVEGIRRKPLGLKAQLALQRVGFVFLVSLMAFAFVNDIGRVFQRRKAVDKPVEVGTVEPGTNS
ncbi:MAG: RIP metalloprotease RseP, partial [Candidatus Eisenbacteria bacterium]|nr:RIP metalloprotease RseP [Candidatus Eisenbacteria bacterium]